MDDIPRTAPTDIPFVPPESTAIARIIEQIEGQFGNRRHSVKGMTREDAEDIFQDALLALHRALTRQAVPNPGAYFIKAIRTTELRRRLEARRRRRLAGDRLSIEGIDLPVEEDLEWAMLLRAALAGVGDLPECERIALQSHLNGVPWEVRAERLGATKGCAWKHFSNAVRHLRTMIVGRE